MEQQFSLSWNNFHGNITKEFSSLLANSEFVDVTLAVDGQLLQAHKIVLSICSPYFKRMFKLNPCQHPIVVLRGVTVKAMKDLLHFMYHGEVSVRQEDLTSFISTAEILQIKGLTNKTSEDDGSETQSQIRDNDKPREILQATTDSPFDMKSDDASLISERNISVEHQQINNRQTGLKRKSDDLQTNTSNIYNCVIPTVDIDIHSNDKKCKIREKTLNTVRHSSVLNPRTKLFEYDTSISAQYSEPAIDSLDSSNVRVQNEEHSENSMDVKAEVEEPMYSVIQRRYSDSILNNSQDTVRVNGTLDEHQQNKTDLSEKNEDGFKNFLSNEGPRCDDSIVSYGARTIVESLPSLSLHTIVTIPQKEDGKKKYPQRSCRTCWRSGRRRDTRFMCAECTIPLCKTSCFDEHLCDILNTGKVCFKSPVK